VDGWSEEEDVSRMDGLMVRRGGLMVRKKKKSRMGGRWQKPPCWAAGGIDPPRPLYYIILYYIILYCSISRAI
jgi:hypothetical protein